MFSNKEAKKEAEEHMNSSNIIGKGTSINGDVETVGNLRIDGNVYGNIKTKTKLAVGDTAYIEGKVMAQNAEIEGEIKGTLEVSELLILKSTAVINGDIITNKIAVEGGASFNGTCKMGAVVKEIELEIDNGKQSESRSGAGAGAERAEAKEETA